MTGNEKVRPSLRPVRQAKDEIIGNQITYWKKQLHGELPLLQLPTDRLRSVTQTYSGASHVINLSQSLAGALSTFAQEEDVTLFILGLTAFKILLHRYTGQDDILVGTCAAHLAQSSPKGSYNIPENILVLRTNLSGNHKFRELLEKVESVVSGAYDNRDVSLEKLVEEILPEQKSSYQSLFRAMYLHDTSTVGKDQSTSVDLTGVDLALTLTETADSLAVSVHYNRNLFDEVRMVRLLGHYETLLAGIAANPDQAIALLPLLTFEEQQQLLVEWNDTAAAYPRDACIHHLFEAQVEKTPEATAVQFDNQQLTYQELNQQANQLAKHLQGLGVGPETIVGICVERSLEMVVGLLGILKAGGAYLPLDPNYPLERLAYMLADTQATVILTQERQLNSLPATGAQIICLDQDWSHIAQQPAANIESSVTADNLAYIIYTSGSTGTPKGVMIEHRSLVNHNLGIIRDYGLHAGDRVLQFASISFDVAAEELYPTWLSGATVVLWPGQSLVATAEFLRYVAHEQLTVLNLPTPYWHELVAHLALTGEDLPACLRLVVIGSDKAQPEQYKLWRQLVGDRVGWRNAYGPTEATITATIYQPDGSEDLDQMQIVPVGRPIANAQIYLLDSYMQPVPLGIAGELYIGGGGLARGYLNRPDLTSEKFIGNPFVAGQRLYRTGDLARWLSDGNLEFLGRADDQVKIRGIRIEPGEVEAVLNRHPEVGSAVVMVVADEGRENFLAAYIIPEMTEPSVAGIRDWLREKLPAYMVPATYTLLTEWPMTPNGKIDRKALPKPDENSLVRENAFVPPRNETEEMIAGIWQKLLGIEQVGIFDNFLELGGHSLLIVQMVSQLREVFQVDLPLRSLFEAMTINELAQQIEIVVTDLANQTLEPSISLQKNDAQLEAVIPDEGVYPVSYNQKAIWFMQQIETELGTYNISFAMRIHSSIDVDVLREAVQALVDRHAALRTTFRSDSGELVQEVHGRRAVQFEQVDAASWNEEERQEAVDRYGRRPFDLQNDTLLRVTLFSEGETAHTLLLSVHHLVSDGWSLWLILDELLAEYAARREGSKAALPELRARYSDYVRWQAETLNRVKGQQAAAYWQKQLEDARPSLDLPTDRPRPVVQTFNGGIHSFVIDEVMTEKLRALATQKGMTLYMTLLAAFQTLLYRYTEQKDIVVGSPMLGRSRDEYFDVVGCFMNPVMLRAQLVEGQSFSDLLGQVREVVLSALEHQDYPLQLVAEALWPQRDRGQATIYQVEFFLHKPQRLEEIFTSYKAENGCNYVNFGGLALEPVVLPMGEGQVDLALVMDDANKVLLSNLTYNTDLFDSETIERMEVHFQTLLAAIVADPEQPIALLQLLTDEEKKQILRDWNGTTADYPQEKCIHQLFEEQVEKTPEATAVQQGDKQLSYRELNQRANQLAHYLQELGVGPETTVGLYVERSPEMVVGMLGVLKAGGAYLPLDTTYPAERLAFMVQDAQVSLLLTQEQLRAQAPAAGVRQVSLDGEWAEIAQRSTENPFAAVTPENLAYIIYTSGSTGQPKGVMIQHRSLVNFTTAAGEAYEIGPEDRMLQFASISWDTSVEEIYPSLTRGATLVLRSDGGPASAAEFLRQCAAQGLTLLNLPTAYWHVITSSLEAEGLRLPAGVRLVVIGGERALPEQVQRWRRCVSEEVRLVNTYGLTEVTAVATMCDLAGGAAAGEGARNVPIGKPLPNVRTYILDQEMQPVPIGVTGELYIGGAGVARGYLNRPELTAERFIADPYGSEAEGRLYRTGDVARYLPDGNIEYLGRRDNQVKIRGIRIEPGEVEAVLNRHAGVESAVVTAVADEGRDSYLAAYIIPGAAGATVAEIRGWLREKLPEYMVPAAYTLMTAWPMTPSGKIDRKALPRPDENSLVRESMYVAPESPVEEILVEIWSEILRVERVGIHDNFFDLGGHSLMIVQVTSRILQTFGVQISLRDFFEAPTIAELSLIIEEILISELESLSEEEAQPTMLS